jgi:Raf kinase inhibitor-like YbhB/YbcL family protein
MLQHLPAILGQTLRTARPGLEKLMINRPDFAHVANSIEVTSPAFYDRGAIPAKYAADGEGLSPPLQWSGVPPFTRAVLVIEDADSPTASPFVHAIVLDIQGGDGGLAEGALQRPAGEHLKLGRNSVLKAAYLPPDPPPGHGVHRYAFQLFALDDPPAFDSAIGRSSLIKLMRERVQAKGCLIGTYGRG